MKTNHFLKQHIAFIVLFFCANCCIIHDAKSQGFLNEIRSARLVCFSIRNVQLENTLIASHRTSTASVGVWPSGDSRADYKWIIVESIPGEYKIYVESSGMSRVLEASPTDPDNVRVGTDLDGASDRQRWKIVFDADRGNYKIFSVLHPDRVLFAGLRGGFGLLEDTDSETSEQVGPDANNLRWVLTHHDVEFYDATLAAWVIGFAQKATSYHLGSAVLGMIRRSNPDAADAFQRLIGRMPCDKIPDLLIGITRGGDMPTGFTPNSSNPAIQDMYFRLNVKALECNQISFGYFNKRELNRYFNEHLLASSAADLCAEMRRVEQVDTDINEIGAVYFGLRGGEVTPRIRLDDRERGDIRQSIMADYFKVFINDRSEFSHEDQQTLLQILECQSCFTLGNFVDKFTLGYLQSRFSTANWFEFKRIYEACLPPSKIVIAPQTLRDIKNLSGEQIRNVKLTDLRGVLYKSLGTRLQLADETAILDVLNKLPNESLKELLSQKGTGVDDFRKSFRTKKNLMELNKLFEQKGVSKK